MGHSIDFHAGSLAPDRPMRTIEPGERLTYRFTATRAGAWLYHCSTMPMSAHIAAGMNGAVIIEPAGLAKVDRSFVLVQSEVYLQSRATDAASAMEVDAEAVSAEQPDYVVFNGLANGYDHVPLSVRSGSGCASGWLTRARTGPAASTSSVPSSTPSTARVATCCVAVGTASAVRRAARRCLGCRLPRAASSKRCSRKRGATRWSAT